ncbi:CPBP family glutamic-type intramembrane protease [Companilactobacillus kedongensis]|uniref:CPBP family glutamic-type intramembrane protease n=1 Tax=Companilactobacillus kedongensis TaxID=2486004 RepID=UPI000F789888|nr:CPBP family glutamic-type intramembrane protease [Companilactobacillus kedongensis]
MRVGESQSTDFTRYLIWIVFAVGTLALKNIVATEKGLNNTLAAVFFIVGLFLTFLMVRRYLRERNSFVDNPDGFVESLTANIGFVALMVILVCAMRLAVSYLQVTGKLPQFVNDDIASSDQKVFLFNLVANVLIITVQQQMVQTGFFFNYFFRKSTSGNAITGVILSGVIAGAITLPGSVIQFFMNMALGWCMALTYLYTKDEKMAMLVAIISAVVGTILI